MEGKEGLKRGALQFGREVPANSGLPGDKIRVCLGVRKPPCVVV